ncbi:MAG: dihydrolipoyllysine-residue succinyltransferase [Bacteroidales bacterium]|nr:dihydrolipoyllysine-residue succinyltransferase [Bacteroidales bacterium]
MEIELKIPSPGESINQVQIAKWLVSDGESVDKDQEVVEIDSDKASFPLSAPETGIIHTLKPEGDTVAVGAVIAIIKETQASPLARKILEDKKIPVGDIGAIFPGKKIIRKDIESFINRKKEVLPGTREEERKKMTTLRLKLAERLVAVKNQTAMLTTFNEINMQAVLKIKETYSELFKEKFGVGIGLMSFFTKAVTIALGEFPQINSMIDGEELVIPHYIDIGIAASTPKGLVVPVLRNTEQLSLSEIEIKIKELAGKARENKISIEEMKGGTFTITNGGVFGSLMSTPILNPPQSAILGMHKIQDRPISVHGQVVIAPMMYVALSYDHRVIDGHESVSFLIRVKEMIEDPIKMLLKGIDPVRLLLDL